MQEHPSPPCLRLWCPAVSNYSNHRSSTISCHSQMGIQAAVLVFQRDHVSRGRSWLQLTGWWWLHNLVESLTHKLLRSPWHDKWRLAMHVCVCVSECGVQPHQCLLYYIHFCVRADFTAICLFGQCCVSVRNQTRGIHHRRERKQSRSGHAVHPSGWIEQKCGLCAAF